MTATVKELEEGLSQLPSSAVLDQEISEIIGPLQHRHEQLTAMRADMQSRYNAFKAQVESEIAKVERVMKAAGWKEKKATRKKSDGGDPKPSAESVERLVRWLASQDDARNYNEIQEGLGIANSTANKQVQVARELSLVRIARHGGETGRMMYFGVFEDAVERLDRGDVQWP
jgi:hypothetical protein